jgi:gamma-glutamyltranspeptidase/glutathione hydrolase
MIYSLYKILFLPFMLVFVCTLYSYPAITNVDTAKSAMVVTAHPEATKIGTNILKKGGNAVDAAVAIAFAIGVVEPYASGLGGGGGMLIYLKKDNRYHYLDYYMQSPLNFDRSYTRADGIADARAICIPGTPSGLITAVEQFGNLPLKDVMEPAINMAKNGVLVNRVFYNAIVEKLEVIMTFTETQNIFFSDEGLPFETGDTIKNPDLFNVLNNIQKNGCDYFYKGEFAQNAASGIQKYGGSITYDDFVNYKTIIKEPLCIDYKGYKIFTAPPPQSGLTLLEILNIIENVSPKVWKEFSKSALSTHVLIESIKRADIDRRNFLGDPRFVIIPIANLLNKKYAHERFKSINLTKVEYESHFDIPTGNPEKYMQNIPDSSVENQHTTHISVIDQEGNAVSLTQTLGVFFGSGLSVDGVLFNSSMSIFYGPDTPNGVASNKRPLSTICPTIIMKENQIFSVLGTPGGASIFNTMAEVILRLIDFKHSPIESVDAPRFSTRITQTNVNFEDRFSQTTLDSLSQIGHKIRVTEEYNIYMGGIQLIYWDKLNKAYIGISDPRRAGAALGIN